MTQQTLTLKQARQQFNIHPRTKTALTAWEVADIITVGHDIKQAAQGIAWALGTGRLSGSVEMAIRQMSTYQTLKLLVDVVNGTETMNDVPGHLNRTVKI